jgi:hypothetical protein
VGKIQAGSFSSFRSFPGVWQMFGPFYFRHNFLSCGINSKNFSDLKTRLFWLPFRAATFENNMSIGLESGLNLIIFSFNFAKTSL